MFKIVPYLRKSFTVISSSTTDLFIFNILIFFLYLIFQIVAEKQKFKKNPHNYAIKKTFLLKQKVRDQFVLEKCVVLTKKRE